MVNQMQPKKYCQGTLQKALEEIRSGSLTAYAANKKYNIPTTTLSYKLKGLHTQTHGNEKVLSTSNESQLAEWILFCAAAGCPKTTKEILEAATELASLEGRTFKGGIPSSGWLKLFLKRHPEISKRTPEPLGKASSGLTADRLVRYFQYLHRQFEQAQMLHLLDRPSSWWNVDETNFLMNPVPRKVYAKKGAKVVYNVERGKPKENITCTYAVAADGSFIPPLITFKESFSDLFAAATASGSVGANFGFNQTVSGWMKGDAFYFFVTQHLHPRWIEMGVQRPIVLVVDGYSGHHSLKLYRSCYDNEVMLVVLYPNSTHILQVLDVAVFGPLKTKYTELYQKWKSNNPGKVFNEVDFVKLLKQANDYAIKKETIINGWRSTGLQPFDVNNIKTNRLTQTPDNISDSSLNSPKSTKILNSQLRDDIWLKDLNSGASDGDDCSGMILLKDEGSSRVIDLTNKSLDTIDETDNSICLGETSTSTCYQQPTEGRNEWDQLPTSSFECDFNLENQSPNSTSNETVREKTRKLVSKARDVIQKLRIHLKVNEPSNMINILIMEQQLNIIEPVVIESLPLTPLPRTASDVLKLPSVVNNSNRKRKGLKVSYGVMSDLGIIKELEQRESEEKTDAEDREADEVAKAEREKRLLEAKEELSFETERLKSTRERLKMLEAEASAERKKITAKRKLRNENKKGKNKQLITPDSSVSSDSKKRPRMA